MFIGFWVPMDFWLSIGIDKYLPVLMEVYWGLRVSGCLWVLMGIMSVCGNYIQT